MFDPYWTYIAIIRKNMLRDPDALKLSLALGFEHSIAQFFIKWFLRLISVDRSHRNQFASLLQYFETYLDLWWDKWSNRLHLRSLVLLVIWLDGSLLYLNCFQSFVLVNFLSRLVACLEPRVDLPERYRFQTLGFFLLLLAPWGGQFLKTRRLLR